MNHSGCIDLRSDTVTRPCPGMRQAMAQAEVGDDVYAEDPTVIRLEEEAAQRTGHQAALFVPSGTMGNQIAVNLLSRPGSDVLVDEDCHVYRYELGAMAAWSGALPRVIRSRDGRITPEDVELVVAPDVYYLAPTKLLVLENTHNHAGGTVMNPVQLTALIECARKHGLFVHLDGARLFNAAAALRVRPAELAAGFDTVMFCLSKGLGAPVGSLLCGSTELIREARIVRKRMGGGLRQAGVLAAAGLWALQHNADRLGQDHTRAKRLAQAIAEHPQFEIDPDSVQTNIVIAAVRRPERRDALLTALDERGVLAGEMGPGRIRFVTHLDVDDGAIQRAIELLRQVDPG